MVLQLPNYYTNWECQGSLSWPSHLLIIIIYSFPPFTWNFKHYVLTKLLHKQALWERVSNRNKLCRIHASTSFPASGLQGPMGTVNTGFQKLKLTKSCWHRSESKLKKNATSEKSHKTNNYIVFEIRIFHMHLCACMCVYIYIFINK